MSGSVLSPPSPRPVTRLPAARVRAWLTTAIAALLVLIYLTIELTYSSAHLPPQRYAPVAPGGVAHGKDADFRLVSLRQTEGWGREIGGRPGSPEPGAVWVVAELEVTPREHTDYLLCPLDLVAVSGRSWDAEGSGPTHEGESCAPDPKNVRLGTTYPFVLGYEVPASDADRLAGLALELFNGRKLPLLRPPA